MSQNEKNGTRRKAYSSKKVVRRSPSDDVVKASAGLLITFNKSPAEALTTSSLCDKAVYCISANFRESFIFANNVK